MTGTSDGETVSKTMTYTPGGMMETYSDGERVEQNTYIRGETRIKKAEGPSLQNLTDITNYFYQEGSVLYTTDGESNPESFNLLNISDIFGTERVVESDDNYYFYLDDIRGSKTGLIDSTAGSGVSYWYNDFGEVSEERSDEYEDFINEVQYTGAIYDSSTGLIYLNARFYDPSTGRFTSQDSYRGEREKPGNWHIYVYCSNNPINLKDNNGHSPVSKKLYVWDYYWIHRGVQLLVQWSLRAHNTVIEQLVYCGNQMGRLDIYDYLMNEYYEVKSIGAAYKASTRSQMHRYDHSIVNKLGVKPRRGSNSRIQGAFYYGAHYVSYWYSQKGLIVYKTRFVESKYDYYRKLGKSLFYVKIGIVCASAIATGGAALPLIFAPI